MNKTLKDRIAQSAATLPVAVLLAAAFWVAAADSFDLFHALGFVTTMILTLLLRQWAHELALMRLRSWLVPSVYILLAAIITYRQSLRLEQAAAAAYIAALFFLFQAYQQRHPERTVCAAFFCLSLGSWAFPPVLWLSLPFLLAMMVQLRIFTPRTLSAMFFGLCVPMVFFSSYCVLTGKLQLLLSFARDLVEVEPLWPFVLVPRHVVTIGLLLGLFILSAVHFAYTNFNDKIRTRMFFYVLLTQSGLLLVAAALQPRHSGALFDLLLPVMAPVVAHYFAFSRGFVARVLFLLSFIFILLTGLFNLWNPSSLFF